LKKEEENHKKNLNSLLNGSNDIPLKPRNPLCAKIKIKKSAAKMNCVTHNPLLCGAKKKNSNERHKKKQLKYSA
jgi:hypothetical protein